MSRSTIGVLVARGRGYAVRPLRVQYTARRLPQACYSDLQSFHRAYFTAPVELREYELV